MTTKLQENRDEKYYEKKEHRRKVKEYRLGMKHYLLTSRFSSETWNENVNYRNQHPNIGCIYCAPEPNAKCIPVDSILFVLEMNNDTNKIMGIGLVRNHPVCNKYYVYENGNYNRYVFIGKKRIDRSEMTEEEEQIMKVFDILCFTGNQHMKRGQGLKSFPADMLYNCSKKLDLVKFVSNIFKLSLIHI